MKSRVYSILYMFALTVAFTALVGGVKSLSQDRIQRNQELKLQRIILRVLDIKVDRGTSDQDLAALFKSRIKTTSVGDRLLYLARAEKGPGLAGIAFPVGGKGFWGPIQGIAAVDPKGEKLVGLAFYKHSETPGLGGRMTEPWFQDQFKGLALRPMEKGRKIFYFKPAGASRKPEELDAITGATQSSMAIEAFLNQELDYFLKNIMGKLEGEKS